MASSASKLALLGGAKVVTAKSVSPKWPRFSEKAVQTVASLLRQGKGISLGQSKIVLDAEAAFAEYHGVKYALAVNTGTASLHCAVAGCGVAPGDEVITSPYSWGATTGCILHQGAAPVYADVLEETGLIDPASVERNITRRTRAIVVVHIYGQPCDMRPLQAIARKHKLALIEDCSQAHGALYRGKRVGGMGAASGFSCMGGKLLATTEMGMFITDDRDIYDRALLSSMHPCRLFFKVLPQGGGLSAPLHKYADSLSINYRTSDINCVLLMDQLPHLKQWNAHRAANRDSLASQVTDIEFIRFPKYLDHIKPAYHMATLRFDKELARGVKRRTFLTAIQAEGVGAFNYIPHPISTWTRLNARGYDGPPVSWMPSLKQSSVRYSQRDIPVCMKLAKESSVQITFNNFTEPEGRLMGQIARAFHKVAENLPALRDWQAKQEAKK